MTLLYVMVEYTHPPVFIGVLMTRSLQSLRGDSYRPPPVP